MLIGCISGSLLAYFLLTSIIVIPTVTTIGITITIQLFSFAIIIRTGLHKGHVSVLIVITDPRISLIIVISDPRTIEIVMII